MLKAIGLMSGTSLDGVDVALIKTDGERIGAFGPTAYRAYSDRERDLLRKALADAVPMTNRDARPGVLVDAEQLVTACPCRGRRELYEDTQSVAGRYQCCRLSRSDRAASSRTKIDGTDRRWSSAGKNAWHSCGVRHARGGCCGGRARRTPCAVYHRALVQGLKRNETTVVVNIGGVANITYIDGDTLIACDTGPGNALLDDFMLRRTGKAVDRDGRAAAMGHVNVDWIAHALSRPFFYQAAAEVARS